MVVEVVVMVEVVMVMICKVVVVDLPAGHKGKNQMDVNTARLGIDLIQSSVTGCGVWCVQYP